MRDLVDDEQVVGGRTAALAGDADQRAARDGFVRVNVLALHDLTVVAVGALINQLSAVGGRLAPRTLLLPALAAAMDRRDV